MHPGETTARQERAAEVAALVVGVLSTLVVLVAHLGDGEAVVLERPLLDGSGGYGFLHVDEHTRLPARFDPCEPIAYVVNPEGAPHGAIDDVREAFDRASVATGITFVHEGLTDERPRSGRDAYQPDRYGARWAPVLVAWADLSEISLPHRGGDVLGWASQHVMTHPQRQDVVVSGMVVLALEGPAVRPGFGAGRRWGNVALHEVGHLLGLDHVDDRDQIMNADAGHAAGRWGEGDLAGLAHLGRDAGCVPVPEAR